MDSWIDWFGLLFIVAAVYILVRPTSNAKALVDGFAAMLISLTRQVTVGTNS